MGDFNDGVSFIGYNGDVFHANGPICEYKLQKERISALQKLVRFPHLTIVPQTMGGNVVGSRLAGTTSVDRRDDPCELKEPRRICGERVKTLYYNVPPSCANSKSLILGMNAVTLVIDDLNGVCFIHL